MDERATFTFERAIQWNYTIIEGDAHPIANGSESLNRCARRLSTKPVELPFFIREDLRCIIFSLPSRGALRYGARTLDCHHRVLCTTEY